MYFKKHVGLNNSNFFPTAQHIPDFVCTARLRHFKVQYIHCALNCKILWEVKKIHYSIEKSVQRLSSYALDLVLQSLNVVNVNHSEYNLSFSPRIPNSILFARGRSSWWVYSTQNKSWLECKLKLSPFSTWLETQWVKLSLNWCMFHLGGACTNIF